jgi:hypothetical protein
MTYHSRAAWTNFNIIETSRLQPAAYFKVFEVFQRSGVLGFIK